MKILVCGLPGSGKTYISRMLANQLDCMHFDADVVRHVANDWDFTDAGRMRQAMRMRELADVFYIKKQTVICSFIAPTEKIRTYFNPTLTIYCTRDSNRNYKDTNDLFEIPTKYHFHYDGNTGLTTQNVDVQLPLTDNKNVFKIVGGTDYANTKKE
jgi:adenylylsulfate kinase